MLVLWVALGCCCRGMSVVVVAGLSSVAAVVVCPIVATSGLGAALLGAFRWMCRRLSRVLAMGPFRCFLLLVVLGCCC